MGSELEILRRRLQREINKRMQAETIAEDKSRELYLKSRELESALQAAENARITLEGLYREVERLSRLDPLTGLNNRRSFFSDADHAVQLGHRHRRPVSCAMLDIDHFKRINDTWGHDAGDRVLVDVAIACRESIRRTDHLARFGGEEFCFLFPETDLAGAAVFAENIRSAIASMAVKVGANLLSVTVSMGVSTLLDASDSLEQLIKRSDLSLYQAKASGRNCVVVARNVNAVDADHRALSLH